VPIRYIAYQQIDKLKWDTCIDTAGNGLVYAYSFYLDTMAKHWDALILNDYEAVMPLTWNKKYGIAYLYQPAFTQQLGIFSKRIMNEAIRKSFIVAAQQRFRFAEIYVNFNCGIGQPNFILPLHHPYSFIQQGYKNDLLKNLKHAAKFSLSYVATDDITTAIDLYRSHYAVRTPHVKQKDYQHFQKVCEMVKQNGNLLIRKVVDDKETTLAIALLLKDKKRLYNVLSTVTKEGRQCEANHYLFDNVIQEFCGQELILDFEGSSIAGIAGFYQKFGALNESYYFLRYNRLPWLLKYFK
jgi:hypothetical protein